MGSRFSSTVIERKAWRSIIATKVCELSAYEVAEVISDVHWIMLVSSVSRSFRLLLVDNGFWLSSLDDDAAAKFQNRDPSPPSERGGRRQSSPNPKPS